MNKLSSSLLFALLIAIIAIIALQLDNSEYRYRTKALQEKNEELAKANKELTTKFDSTLQVVVDANKHIEVIEKDKKQLLKRNKIYQKELASIQDKYIKLQNDSIAALVQIRFNPNSIPSDTIPTTRIVLEHSLETQDSLHVAKKIIENKDSTLVNREQRISEDSTKITAQGAAIEFVQEIVNNNMKTLKNKDEEIDILKTKNTRNGFKWFGIGGATGVVITVLLILLL